MDPLEITTHTFVVRLWLERVDVAGERVALRGHVTHLPDGVRRPLRSTEELRTIIEAYLIASGRRFGWRLQRRQLRKRPGRWQRRRT